MRSRGTNSHHSRDYHHHHNYQNQNPHTSFNFTNLELEIDHESHPQEQQQEQSDELEDYNFSSAVPIAEPGFPRHRRRRVKRNKNTFSSSFHRSLSSASSSSSVSRKDYSSPSSSSSFPLMSTMSDTSMVSQCCKRFVWKNNPILRLVSFFFQSSNTTTNTTTTTSIHWSLILAVFLWYSLGVISISTSKFLLMNGIPPLVLTLQQLCLGSTFLRWLLWIRFMDLSSTGLQSWQSVITMMHTTTNNHTTNDIDNIDSIHEFHSKKYYNNDNNNNHTPSMKANHPTKKSGIRSTCYNYYFETIPSVLLESLSSTLGRYLILAGLCFSFGFLATNVGFSGTSASFVETVKAAEPITSALLAVSNGLEVLVPMESASLMAIVVGVLLSTVGNTHPATTATTAATTTISSTNNSTAFYASCWSCGIVMTSNLCFSLRGLYQKLFQKHGGTLDDLNLQFRMQQMGAMVLVIPTLLVHGQWLWNTIVFHSNSPISILWTLLLQQDPLITTSTSTVAPILACIRFVGLILVNGLAFTSYNLASTYLLSRISVVHHAALNCIRRIFAILVTSIVFAVPITLVGALGILISVAGFMTFTYAKAQKTTKRIIPTTTTTTVTRDHNKASLLLLPMASNDEDPTHHVHRA